MDNMTEISLEIQTGEQDNLRWLYFNKEFVIKWRQHFNKWNIVITNTYMKSIKGWISVLDTDV